MPKYTDEECKALVVEHGYQIRGDMVWTDCHRCGGSGVFRCWSHIANGACFLCGGQRGRLRPIRKIATLVRRQITTEKNAPARAAAKRAAGVVAARAYLAVNPEIHSALAGAGNDFRRAMAATLIQWGSLTDKQAAAVLRARDEAPARQAETDRRAAEAAAVVPVPVTDERIEIHARIVYTKEEAGYAYGSPSVTKGLFICDAGDGHTFKLWGTVPRALWSAEKEDHVVFFAKVQPKNGDPMFGYISRPTKAAIVEG